MGNPNFDAILTTTLNNFTPRLEDNVFSARPLVYWLKSKDRIKTRSGGAKIIEPLIYGLNTTAGSYAGYDSIPTSGSKRSASASPARLTARRVRRASTPAWPAAPPWSQRARLTPPS